MFIIYIRGSAFISRTSQSMDVPLTGQRTTQELVQLPVEVVNWVSKESEFRRTEGRRYAKVR